VKKKIVENTEVDTVLVGRTLRNTARVAKNAVSTQVPRSSRTRPRPSRT
jgi:NAD(P)H-dependent flavin oxidoreductase YrpB (nitropropane dioxygenase family)